MIDQPQDSPTQRPIPVCHACHQPINDPAEVWPGQEGHDICQCCWEAECSLEWWKAVHVLDHLGVL